MERPAIATAPGQAGGRAGKRGLRRKIWLAFTLQVFAIALATVFGVWGASFVLKEVLIKHALEQESDWYWQRHSDDPEHHIPDTFNMMGYLVMPGASTAPLPAPLRALQPGYYMMPEAMGGSLVYVSRKPQGTLYLVFKQTQVNKLAFWFGAVPLAFVLIVVYALAWMSYRSAHRAVSPIIWLAHQVEQWDPKRPDTSALDAANLPVDVQGETLVLASSLHGFARRIDTFVQRERNFTRDASHELRTPMTVIRMAGDVLLADEAMTPQAARNVRRIRSAVGEMESLVEAFLIMAREGDVGLPDEDFVVNEIILDEVEKARALIAHKPVELRLEEQASFALHAPPRVFGVLFGNLLRNACNYTDKGSVTVRVQPARVVIEDTGIGMTAEELQRVFEAFYRGGEQRIGGHGIGLNIVQRLSERFGWPVKLESAASEGTRATVSFPKARPLEG